MKIGRGHDRTRTSRDEAGGDVRRDVDREGAVRARVAVDEAVLDHAQRAEMAFLARLKHELHRAREAVALRVQQAHGHREHRRVAVVAAGVHLAFFLGGEGEARVLRHRQRVHVAAQEHRAALLRTLQRDDEAGGRRPVLDLHVEAVQRLAHGFDRAGQMEAKLGMLVDAAAERHGVGQQRLRLFKPLGRCAVHLRAPQSFSRSTHVTPFAGRGQSGLNADRATWAGATHPWERPPRYRRRRFRGSARPSCNSRW